MKRRTVLILGVVALLSTGPVLPARGANGEAEADLYGGESTGGWICGPIGQVRYGGATGAVRFTQREMHDDKGVGWNGRAAVSGEWQQTTINDCEGECLNRKPGEPMGPPSTLMMGGQARGGYEWRHFGMEFGAGVFQGWDNASDDRPSARLYPQVELRGGRAGKTSIWGVTGIGAGLSTQVQRPGAYVGASVSTSDGWAGDARVGTYRSGPATMDTLEPRVDLAGRMPVARDVQLRAGGAVGIPDAGGPDWEGSLGIVSSF